MSASVTGVTVRIYTKPRCSLCDEARRVLEEIRTRVDFVLGHQVLEPLPRDLQLGTRGCQALTGRGAVALRRVAHGRDGGARFVGRLDVRDEQVLRANVEEPFDQNHVVPRRPYYRCRRTSHQRLQLAQDHRQFVGRVLGVDQDPVEPRAGNHLGRQIVARAAPKTDLRSPFANGLFEGVRGQLGIHDVRWHVLRSLWFKTLQASSFRFLPVSE